MKRSQPTRSNKTNTKPRIVDSRHLTETRGGGDLGITVSGAIMIADVMTPQHNETLIRL